MKQSTRTRLAVVTAGLLTGGGIWAQRVGAGISIGERETVPVVVMLREPLAPYSDSAARSQEIAAVRDRVVGNLAPGDIDVHFAWSSINGFAGEVTVEGLAKLEADPNVAQIDRDVSGAAHLAQASVLIGANLVRASGILGAGVTVAVLDTGVERNHIDLDGDVIDESCFCVNADGDGCCPDGSIIQLGTGSARDDNGHGTLLTGIITSEGKFTPRGIAPHAKIVSVKVLDRDGEAKRISQVVAALDWILTFRQDVQVVNMSLGTQALWGGNCGGANAVTIAFRDGINALRERGVAVFASSGNEGSSGAMSVPACVLNAISVGAVYDDDVGTQKVAGCQTRTGRDVVACFSNASDTLDLLAPGAPIRSAWPGNGTATSSGTSAASAMAAGAAALLLSANPGLEPAAIENALKNTGVPTADPRNGLVYPRIDVLGAVQLVAPFTVSSRSLAEP